MSAPIKVELLDIGPHNGRGEPDVKGSYHAFTLTEKGGEGDWPQRLTFMVPAHQLPVRADLCDPTQDEQVKALVEAVAKGPMLGEDMRRWIDSRMKDAAALRALEQGEG